MVTKVKESPAPDAGEMVTLDEFCSRLSRTVRRVELIGGFYAVEKKAGHLKDTEPVFQAAFDKYRNRPIQ